MGVMLEEIITENTVVCSVTMNNWAAVFFSNKTNSATNFSFVSRFQRKVRVDQTNLSCAIYVLALKLVCFIALIMVSGF